MTRLTEQDRAFIRELPMMLLCGSAVFLATAYVGHWLRFEEWVL